MKQNQLSIPSPKSSYLRKRRDWHPVRASCRATRRKRREKTQEAPFPEGRSQGRGSPRGRGPAGPSGGRRLRHTSRRAHSHHDPGRQGRGLAQARGRPTREAPPYSHPLVPARRTTRAPGGHGGRSWAPVPGAGGGAPAASDVVETTAVTSPRPCGPSARRPPTRPKARSWRAHPAWGPRSPLPTHHGFRQPVGRAPSCTTPHPRPRTPPSTRTGVTAVRGRDSPTAHARPVSPPRRSLPVTSRPRALL